MSDGDGVGNRLSPAVSGAYAAVWLFLMLGSLTDQLSASGLDRFRDPADAAGRVASRDLAIAFAASDSGESSSWALAFGGNAGGEDDWEETLEYAVELHVDAIEYLDTQDLGDSHETSRARMRLSLLLAEQGHFEEALEAAEAAQLPGLRQGLSFLHGEGPEPGPGFENTLALGEGSWLGDRWIGAYARRLGAENDADAIDAQQRERARALRQAADRVWAANGLLILAGLVALVWMSMAAGQTSPRTPPFTLSDGLGVLVRGDTWGRLYFLGLGWMPAEWAWSTVGTFLYSWGTLFSSLPLMGLIAWHLLRPLAAGLRDPFGLRLGFAAFPRWVRVGLAAIAIDLAGSTLFGWGLWSLGVYGDWSETIDETLIWGSVFEAALVSADYVVWAPFFEEVAFRGLLFFSLRTRFGLGTAALISATAFSAVHFYSLPGFVATWWSGLIWAWAFERAGSLWPGVVAHGVYNALFVAGVVAVYR